MIKQLFDVMRSATSPGRRWRSTSAGLGIAVIATTALAGGMAAADPASAATSVNAPPVGVAATADNGGYWEVASDGGIFAFGDAGFYGSMGGKPLNAPVVGIAATPDGKGYWEVASDGGIFAFGDAGFYGSMGGKPLNAPVVGIAATPDGKGYWEVASDGGIFAFGDAGFYGSMGGKPLNAPVVGIAATPDGKGYWEVASDGGIFAFGDAGFHGSMGGKPLNAPVVGIAATPDGKGYWEVASDGGIFAFGDAGFYGSMAGKPLNAPVVSLAAATDGKGYWEVASDGGIFAFGDSHYDGSVQYTGPSSAGTPVTPAAEQQYAYSQFATYGWGTNQQSPLQQLWNRESSWNPEAINASSGAYGIPQALPQPKGSAPYPSAYAAANPPRFGGTSDPRTQIRWGESYISRRYGTPQSAWNHEKTYGWY